MATSIFSVSECWNRFGLNRNTKVHNEIPVAMPEIISLSTNTTSTNTSHNSIIDQQKPLMGSIADEQQLDRLPKLFRMIGNKRVR
jgi:hypothetical protein